MRKLISLLLLLCLSFCLVSYTAAAEVYELLPVEVITHPDKLEIHKIYEMSTSAPPEDIPREDFTRDKYLYSCSDILREVVIGDEVKTIIETETTESPKNDIESVLELLPQTKEIVTEDGYYGVLHLNTTSIRSEVSGYGNTTKSVTTTRSYPNLSNADAQHIPKTVTESGRTYTLEDIQWQTDNTYNVDDYEIGDRYTAIATYSGTKSSSYVKGYIVTADYVGDVCRTGVSLIRYTVIYNGTEVETTEPAPTEEIEAEPTPPPESGNKSGFNWLYAVLPLLGLLAGAGGLYIYQNKIKEYRHNAQDTNYDHADNYSDAGNGDSGNGSGL